MQKKISYVSTFFTIIVIVFFNVFTPSGKVLFEYSFLRITQGALLDGLEKAITFEGLIFVSKLMTGKALFLPFKIGELLSMSFRYLESITSRKAHISPKRIVESLDNLFFEIEQQDHLEPIITEKNEAIQPKNIRYFILALLVMISYIPHMITLVIYIKTFSL